MTDIKKENVKPLIETEDFEEEISLVSSDGDTNKNMTPNINKPVTLESNANTDWDDQTTTTTTTNTTTAQNKIDPLSTPIVVEDYDSDPWAQPENALLAVDQDEVDEAEDLVVKQPYQQTPATATVFDAIDTHAEPLSSTKEDQDTSAIKVSFFFFINIF